MILDRLAVFATVHVRLPAQEPSNRYCDQAVLCGAPVLMMIGFCFLFLRDGFEYFWLINAITVFSVDIYFNVQNY